MIGKGVMISLGLVVVGVLIVASASASITMIVYAAVANQVMLQAHDTTPGLGLCQKAFEAGTIERAQCIHALTNLTSNEMTRVRRH